METPVPAKVRTSRTATQILQLLEEQKSSRLSVKAFCAHHNIANATFHNWRKKLLTSSPAKQPGFAAVQIKPAIVAEATLFAQVRDIKIYQPVTAAYLKELAL